MAADTSRTENVVAGMLTALLVLTVLFWLGYSVRPHGFLAWITISFIVVASSLLINWADDRVVRTRLYSRAGSVIRLLVRVPIRSACLLSAALVIQFGLQISSNS